MKRIVHLMLMAALPALVACSPQETSKPAKAAINVVLPSDDSGKGSDQDLAKVLDGVKMVQAGHVQAAIDGPFDDVIRRYEAQYRASKVKIYSARGLNDTLFYSSASMADKSPVSSIVLGPAWAMAYWGRGYAYNEMARYDDAIVELRKALVLAPADSQYLGELAYAFQQKRDFKQSLSLYLSAFAYADLTTEHPDILKCTSLRGQGYDLVELHRLSEAEAAYRACLKITPNEPKSLGELEYIRQLIAKQAQTKGD